MSDGLIHSYIETLSRTLRPNDDYYWQGRDSKSRRRALRSPPDSGGNSHEDGPNNPGNSGGCRT